jgi:hypothetical protein
MLNTMLRILETNVVADSKGRCRKQKIAMGALDATTTKTLPCIEVVRHKFHLPIPSILQFPIPFPFLRGEHHFQGGQFFGVFFAGGEGAVAGPFAEEVDAFLHRRG